MSRPPLRSNKRKNFYPNFKRKLPKKMAILKIEAPFGIIGLPGSGRKTLAYRFANLNRGTFQDGEIPVAYCYRANFSDRISAPNNRFAFYRLGITAYIIDPPAELPLQDPPLYQQHWNDFCCLVFIYDVRNQESFHEVSMRLTAYRQENRHVPPCFIVGNKTDIRNNPPSMPENLEDPEYINQRPVSETTGYIEADNLGAIYFECSAKNNTGVKGLSTLIKIFAFKRKYWIEGA